MDGGSTLHLQRHTWECVCALPVTQQLQLGLSYINMCMQAPRHRQRATPLGSSTMIIISDEYRPLHNSLLGHMARLSAGTFFCLSCSASLFAAPGTDGDAFERP